MSSSEVNLVMSMTVRRVLIGIEALVLEMLKAFDHWCSSTGVVNQTGEPSGL